MAPVLSLSAGLLAAYWLAILIKAWLGVRATPALPPLPDSLLRGDSLRDDSLQDDLPSPARVTVIIPVRNEQARLQQTVERLLDQRHVALDVVIVNDRSTDQTGSIARQLAQSHPDRVTCVTVEELPAQWLGKCHACWLGAQQARGDWLLFTDGDIHMSRDVVARGIAQATNQQADHLTLLPNTVAGTWGLKVAMVGQVVLLMLYASPARINRDRGRAAIGIGAFNLIRRTAYETVGGHRALPMKVLDDMHLALLVRQHGLRLRVYSGVDDIQADWATSVRGVIGALEKNWFAAVDYRWSAAMAVLVGIPASIVLAATGPFWAGAVGWWPLVAWLSIGLPGMRVARDYHWPWHVGWCCTLGWLVFVAAGVRSVWMTARQGGIRWRDRFYPLAELRR